MAKTPKAARRRTARPVSAFLIACDAVSKDPNTNKATIYGVFDLIWTDKFPAQARFAIYAKVFAPAGCHTFAIEILSPGGSVFTLEDESMRFELEDGKGADIGISLAGVPFNAEGVYTLTLVLDGRNRSTPYFVRAAKHKRKKAKR